MFDFILVEIYMQCFLKWNILNYFKKPFKSTPSLIYRIKKLGLHVWKINTKEYVIEYAIIKEIYSSVFYMPFSNTFLK